ncbi:unnamed protein product [Closterium sp. Naga37s-1]|nr:unnamed protein product [Closterium sp. Naga37s-1]
MPPKNQRSKTVVDTPVVTANDDVSVVNDDVPANGGINEEATVVNEPVAGSSGLSVEEKATMDQSSPQSSDAVEDYEDEDTDDEMEVDTDKEDVSRLRSTAILLLPFILSQEVACVIDAVKMLMKRGWYAELSVNALSTAKFQVLQPSYIAKVRYCRLQISFLLDMDVETVMRKEVVYQRLNGNLVKLHWQHTENVLFAREKALHPQAIEVIFKGVSAVIDPDLLVEQMSTYLLKSTKRPAFARSSNFHPLISTGSNREEWVCTQDGCGKAKGKSFMAASDHVASAAHMLHLEKFGTATRVSLEKANLTIVRKEYGF